MGFNRLDHRTRGKLKAPELPKWKVLTKCITLIINSGHHFLWINEQKLDGIPGMVYSSGTNHVPNQMYFKYWMPEKVSGEAHLLFLNEFPGRGIIQCLDKLFCHEERRLCQETEHRKFFAHWRKQLDLAYPFLPRGVILPQRSDHKEWLCWWGRPKITNLGTLITFLW